MRHIFIQLGTQGAVIGQPRRSSGSHRHTLTTRNQKYGIEFYGKGSDSEILSKQRKS